MRRLYVASLGLALAAGLLSVPTVRAQVAGLAWQVAGVAVAPVRTVNVASGGTFSSSTGTLTITGGGGGGGATWPGYPTVANLFSQFGITTGGGANTIGRYFLIDTPGQVMTSIRFAMDTARTGTVEVWQNSNGAKLAAGSFSASTAGVYTAALTATGGGAFTAPANTILILTVSLTGNPNAYPRLPSPSSVTPYLPGSGPGGWSFAPTQIAHTWGGLWAYGGTAAGFPGSGPYAGEAYLVEPVF